MSSSDLTHLSPADYPFIARINTRYSDLDPQNHINNVAVAAIYEEGRSQFLRWLAADTPYELETPRRMIAQIQVSYLAQIHYPAQLAVAGGILYLGQRSYRIGQAIFHEGRCVGHCETVIVHSDGMRGIAITADWRETLIRAALR